MHASLFPSPPRWGSRSRTTWSRCSCFYEALTLSTYPLVTHAGTPEARRAGRVYLGVLLGTSIGFQLLAIAWTYAYAGTVDFRDGGILSGMPGGVAAVVFCLFAFGVGKAALMPFHRWLPAAMVAPTPVSALLHAVAVVKAGVFTILKVAVYVFGPDLLATSGGGTIIAWVAGATILIGSLVAMNKDNLKARLAYSTISQLSYVVLGTVLASAWGTVGAALHIVMHAFGKITLFFCAGAVLGGRAQDRDQRDGGPRTADAGDDGRVRGRQSVHHRTAAARRRVEQVVPGDRDDRRRPVGASRRAPGQLAAEHRLPAGGCRCGPGRLRRAREPAGTRRKSTRRHGPASSQS